MSVGQHIPSEIKRATRAIGYALWLNSTYHWSGLHTVLRARLNIEQIAGLAFMALKSLDRKTALRTADAALRNGAGQPITPLCNYMDEAAYWADMADPAELDAYGLACFTRMSPARRHAHREHDFNTMSFEERRAFLEFLRRGQAA